MGFIYKITNTLNQKVYIGQTKRKVDIRFKEHISYSKEKSTHLAHAINKYGILNFNVEVLEECDDDVLNEKEKKWISFYNANNSTYGYNMTAGGESSSDALKIKVYQFALNGSFIKEYDSVSDASRYLGGEKHSSGICSCCSGKIKQYLGYIWSYDKELQNFDLFGSKRWKYYTVTIIESSDLIYEGLNLHEAQAYLKLKSVGSLINILNGSSKSVIGYIKKNQDDANQLLILEKTYKKQYNQHKTKKQVRNRKHVKIGQYDLNMNLIAIYDSVAEAELAVNGNNKGHITQVCNYKRKTAYHYIWRYLENV